MSDWTPTSLSEHVSILHGYAFKGEHFRDSPPGDVLVTPGNFAIGGGFQAAKPKFYNGPAIPGFLLAPGDLIVTMTDLSKSGDTLGYPALVPDDGNRYLHNQRIGKVVLRAGAHVSKQFVHWLMRTKSYRDEVLAGATGSTVRHTSPKKIAAFSFLMPPRRQQDAICQVLTALDDKVELNRRMNETLEAIAQAIFKDWFVDFGPVRRGTATNGDPIAMMGGLSVDRDSACRLAEMFPSFLVDGVPQGWVRRSIYDLASVVYGAPFASARFNTDGSGKPLVRIRDLPSHSTDIFTDEDHPKAHVIQPGDIVVGMDGEFRAYLWHGKPSLMNQRVCSFEPAQRDDRGFTLFSVRPLLRRLEETAVGTTVIHLGKRDIDRFQVVDPGRAIRSEFGRLAEPILDRMVAAGEENRTLAETRDFLLPRLMSGAISVRDAEAVAA